MSVWKSKISELIDSADNISDKIRARLRRFKGFDEPLMIIPFLGYGTNDKFLLAGRVLEDKGTISANETDGKRRNLVNLYRRFDTDEVAGARVRASFQGIEREVVSDDEGYFYVELNTLEAAKNDSLFQEVELELIEPTGEDGQIARAVGQVLVPPASAKFGVISDIDDTILQSNITNKLKMLFTVALLNEYTRVPFKGVAAFYRALQKGAGGDENNPIFYVSSSPWNLYSPLVEFLKIQNIPLGPLFLKDFGNHTIFTSSDHASHKLEKIELILNTYAQLPFVLIGDSGEQDPEIYRQILRKYPNRIRVIYIRSIDTKPERIAAIDKLIVEIALTGCQLVLAPDTENAAAHAAAEKLISAEELPNIREEKREDESAPSIREMEKESEK
jgi:phosphatidate phosphatase APP1